MNKMLPILIVAASVLLFACESRAEGIREYFEKSEETARTLAVVTGTAVNPLLVTAAVGVYKYYSTPSEKRAQLPWFYSPWVWAVCAVLVILAFLVDVPSLVANLPPTISALVELCNKKIGLVITTPIMLEMLYNLFAGGESHALAVSQAYMHASIIPVEWFPFAPGPLWSIAIIPMLLFVFFAIWLLNYVFDILIFLCPFGWVDLCLKTARGIFFTMLLAAAIFFPQLVFILIVPMMIVSVMLLGWSVRRVVMGFVFAKDFLAGQKDASVDGKKGILAFSGSNTGIPSRCVGRLAEEGGNLLFSYKKNFLFSETIILDKSKSVLKKGFFYSKICSGKAVLCLLPPRYQKSAEQARARLGIPGFEEDALKKGMKWFEGRFGAGKAAGA